MGGNGHLGDSKFVVAEKAVKLPRDEETRRGDILRIERERGKWLFREYRQTCVPVRGYIYTVLYIAVQTLGRRRARSGTKW